MSRTAKTTVALAAMAMVMGSAGPAHAFVREQSNWNPGTLPITYYVNQSTIPSSLGTTPGVGAVDAGFATWAAPACTSWRTTDAGNTATGANSGDRTNVILWVSGSWPAELGSVSSVIGVTTPVWNVGGYFIDADIRFNNVGFRWNTTGTGGGSFVDTQSIATHEEGHFLGLDHTPIGSAIMYASYSGGLKRTLGADDQNGVCTIYPSGVAAMDAGMSMSSDPCNAFGTTCAACTPNDGCGFCGASSQCVSGTPTGPTSGACGGGYVWLPRDCSAAGSDAGTGGTGRFGDPCTAPTDCGSGALCVGDGTSPTGFCSRTCNDDCGCPDGYACFGTSDPTLRVCAPGTRMCAMGGTDAGTVLPGDDAAVVPGTDAAVTAGDDASTTDDAGHTTPRRTGGCGCTTAGASGGMGASLLVLAAVGVLGARRRRRAAR